MDQNVLVNHFFRIGSSYYNSSDFQKILTRADIPSVSVTAKFGIGFLSTFMFADTVEIETKSIDMYGKDTIGRRVRIDRIGAIAYVQEDVKIEEGTRVRIRLLPELCEQRDVLAQISRYIKQYILHQSIPIEVALDGDSHLVLPNMTYSLVSDSSFNTYMDRNKLEIITIPIEQYSEVFRGKVLLFFAIQESGLLGVHHEDRFIEVTTGRVRGNRIKVDPVRLIEEFDGNRISVGGFRMKWPKINRLLRRSSTFVSAIYDIDITPSINVEFDVARTKILDKKMMLRAELQGCLFDALKEMKVFDRLEEKTKKYFRPRSKSELIASGSSFYVDDENLLKSVLNELPKDNWPLKVHHKIADKLGIKPGECWNAISTLIALERVANPNLSKKS